MLGIHAVVAFMLYLTLPQFIKAKDVNIHVISERLIKVVGLMQVGVFVLLWVTMYQKAYLDYTSIKLIVSFMGMLFISLIINTLAIYFIRDIYVGNNIAAHRLFNISDTDYTKAIMILVMVQLVNIIVFNNVNK